MVRKYGVLWAFALLMGRTHPVEATPQVVRVEGAIYASTGIPFTGNKDIQVKAYDAATAGTLLWTSDVYNATVNSGRFAVGLDAAGGSSPSLVTQISGQSASASVWFEITVDSGAANGTMDSGKTMSPRIRARGTAFALNAANADALKGVTATAAEMNYLSGVTSGIQSDFQSVNSILANIKNFSCPANQYVTSFDASGLPVCATVTATNPVFTQVDAGDQAMCGLLSDTTLRCWGYNGHGQLGNGSTTNSSIPVVVRGLDGSQFSGVTDISMGYHTACAVKNDGTVWCWGYNSVSQIGDGTTTDRYYPVQVAGITNAVNVASGHQHVCVRKADSTVWCWGLGTTGELGNAVSANSVTPVQVSGITSAIQIAGGVSYNCAVLASGVAKCWGHNASGELGNGTNTASNTPVSVSGLTGVTHLDTSQAASYLNHTCAVKTDGTAWCWGVNGAGGQLGNGTTTPSNTPVQVVGVTGAIQVAIPWVSACALLSGGGVRCWGYNGSGTVGDGSTTTRLTSVPVVGVGGSGYLSSITQIAGGGDPLNNPGYDNMAALTTSGHILTWGNQASGALGNGVSSISAQSTPVGVQYP